MEFQTLHSSEGLFANINETRTIEITEDETSPHGDSCYIKVYKTENCVREHWPLRVADSREVTNETIDKATEAMDSETADNETTKMMTENRMLQTEI